MQGSKLKNELKTTLINWNEIPRQTMRDFVAIAKSERIHPKQMILRLVQECVDTRASGAAKGKSK